MFENCKVNSEKLVNNIYSYVLKLIKQETEA